MIDPDEAAIVVQIFQRYNEGMSPKTIALRLNGDQVPPPRPARGRRLRGWTWTTISGSPKKMIGILNNPLYTGQLVWNRSQKVLDPDTGRRFMRVRPPEEWVTSDVPDLRIVPEALWKAVQARRLGRRWIAKGNLQGRQPKYLFSGLLTCGECGARYIIRTGDYYACSANMNRGKTVCSNTRLVRRERLERVLLQAIFETVFSADTVAYLTRKVNEALERRALPAAEINRRRAEELAQARVELENIASAIRQGVVTPTTKAMLEAAEHRVASLEAALHATQAAPLSLTALPAVIEGSLQNLRETLDTDPTRARGLLATLLGPIPLHRRGDRLIAELRGNLPGLLELDPHWDKSGAGRGI